MFDFVPETPSRSNYKSERTVPIAPVFAVSERASHRMTGTGEEVSEAAPARRESNWPHDGMTRPKSPHFSVSRRPVANAESLAKPDARSEWPASGLTRPRDPPLRVTARYRTVPTRNDTAESAQSASGHVPEWPRRGLTRPKSPKFAPRRAPRSAGGTAKVDVTKKQTSFKPRQDGYDNVFDRLYQPRVRSTTTKAREAKPSDHYTGKPTVFREFQLSSTNSSTSRRQVGDESHAQDRQSSERLARLVKNYNPQTRTRPEPFHLLSSKLHEAAVSRHVQKVEEEERDLQERRKYRAVPLNPSILQHATFVPVLAPPQEVVTVPVESFCTASDERAELRATFEEATRLRLDIEERENQESARAKETEADLQLRAQRESMAFRARAMPDFSNVSELPHVEGLKRTSPHTPHFASRRRSELEQDAANVPQISWDENETYG